MIPREAARLRRILYAAAFLRALAVGLIAVMIGLYCARLGLDAPRIGAVLSAALWGSALATLLTLVAGPRFAPRTMLVVLASLPAAGGIAFMATDAFALMLAAAFVGMFGVHGRDRGAIPILEQALLPATGNDAQRTKVFAWYNVLLDAGYAAGGVAAALPTLLESVAGMTTLDAMHATLGVFCALNAAAALLYARLPARVSEARSVALRELSPASRPIVAKISLLFLVDAFGGGFIGSALFAYFFAERFAASAAAVAVLFGAGRLLSAFSHLVAAWLARRIGLVNTMVFTHLPANAFLMLAAFMPTAGTAIACLLARMALSQMDVSPRQSYVIAVTPPAERAAAVSLTNVPRSLASALSPFAAGVLLEHSTFGWPLVIGGALKIAYDLLLLALFRSVKPRDES